jgi:hypothetical protein
MSALGYRTQEPSDLERENPQFITALVAGLRNDRGYRLDQLAAAAGLLPDEFTHFYLLTTTPRLSL